VTVDISVAPENVDASVALAYLCRLERKQASAIAAAVRDSHDAADQVTKKDLEIALAPIRSELKVQHTLLVAALGGIVAILVRSFF